MGIVTLHLRNTVLDHLYLKVTWEDESAMIFQTQESQDKSIIVPSVSHGQKHLTNALTVVNEHAASTYIWTEGKIARLINLQERTADPPV